MPDIRKKLKDKSTKLSTLTERLGDRSSRLEDYREGDFCNIEIDFIKPNPNQPRKFFDPVALEELCQSVKEKGILQPVIIRKDGNEIHLVAGERRYRAAKMAGLEKIPAVLTTGNPVEISLIENLQRENLKPIEEAEALLLMMEEYGYTQEKIALAIGKARTTITETLSLNKLPDNIKEECRHADIPRRTLVELAKQKNQKQIATLLKQVKDNNLKSDQVRNITRRRAKTSHRTTAAAIVLHRVISLSNDLTKLDLTTIKNKERVQLVECLNKLRQVIVKIIKS